MPTTALDRFVRWNLDFDGDLYGADERERLRWYEGIATAATVQWFAIPLAAAILIWPLGRDGILPLGVLMLLLLLPMSLTTLYVRSHRVDTVPRRWTAKRVLFSTMTGLPTTVFLIGVLRAWQPQSTMWQGAIVGAVIGGLIGVVATVRQVRQRRRRDALVVGDED
jgi:O-antigen/teichoic acid export membrane protein